MARIVIADDDADIRELVVFKLRHGGHEVVPVGDGAAAVEACTAEKPDLVILDVMMPGMSGLDAARALRKGATSLSGTNDRGTHDDVLAIFDSYLKQLP